MVTAFVRGGLGNQMFQYAAGLHLAKRNNTELVLDIAYLNDRFPRKEFTYRTLDLDIFGLEPHLTPLSRISNRVPVPGLWAGLDLAGIKLRRVLGLQNVIYEKQTHRFDARVLSAGKNALLFGFWQNEQYFKDIEADIRKAFTFSIPLNQYATNLKYEIQDSNAVALCSRRGDFVNFSSAKKIMGDTNLSYYESAVEYINAQVKNPRYFVFADDTEFCKQHLKLPSDTVYIGKLGPKWSFHLELMSLCKYNIIPNSTFYWWGAWLGERDGSITIAPQQWYADGRASDGIIPERWIKI